MDKQVGKWGNRVAMSWPKSVPIISDKRPNNMNSGKLYSIFGIFSKLTIILY
jgi:hypothetical protein